MSEIRQIRLIAEANYRRWQHNPQIILCFSLGFILCFLLSDKVLSFAQEHDTVLQCMEPFIWTFGDANAILIISLLLLHLGNEVPFYLIRINRKTWLMGQVVYLVTATFGFISFIFLSTCVLAGGRSYTANLWSETAAILGYSGIGNEIAIPAFVKVLELSFPYKCTLHIYGLMLGYSLLMASLILSEFMEQKTWHDRRYSFQQFWICIKSGIYRKGFKTASGTDADGEYPVWMALASESCNLLYA